MPLPTPIPVHHERYAMHPYYIAGWLPRAMPAAAAFGHSTASIGTADVSDALAEQLAIDLGSTSRWVADPATLVDHGDGTYRWNPAQGAVTSSYWVFDSAVAPTADPTYSWRLRNGTERAIPAFLFGGGVWGRLGGFPDDPFSYTALAVARIRGVNGGAYANLLASAYSGSDPDTATDAATRLRGDYVYTIAAGRMTADRIEDTGRPHLVLSQQTTLTSAQVIGDRDFSWKEFHHPHVSAYDMSWFLARDGGTFNASRTLVMDLLEIALWTRALNTAEIRKVINQLNGVYGITG